MAHKSEGKLRLREDNREGSWFHSEGNWFHREDNFHIRQASPDSQPQGCSSRSLCRDAREQCPGILPQRNEPAYGTGREFS